VESRLRRYGGVALGVSLGLVSCSHGPLREDQESTGKESQALAVGSASDASTTTNPDSRRGIEALRRISEGAAAQARKSGSAPVVSLGLPLSTTYRPQNGRLEPIRAGDGAAGPEVSFAARGNGSFRVRDKLSAVEVAARLIGAHDVVASVVDGYVTYPSAGPAGEPVILRVTDRGTEDYIAFEKRPERPEIRYEIGLSSAVAGLRLIANSLELLDSTGTPRLRVAAPYLVSSDGAIVPASLSVERCAVDVDPREPWDRPTTVPGSQSCDIRIGWDDAAVSYPAVLDPSWSTTASMQITRTNAVSGVLSSGKVIVAGGSDMNGVSTNTTELYNPTTRSWANASAMAVSRVQHAGVLRANGQFMVIGGRTAIYRPAVSSTESYNPTTGYWSATASTASVHDNVVALRLNTNDILIVDDDRLSTAAERFSNSTATWSAAGTPVSYVSGHTLTALSDGKVLLVGGGTLATQIYNPTTNSWAAGANTLTYHGDHTATRLSDGKVLVVGGAYDSHASELYDPANATWTRTGGTSFAHNYATASLLADGRVVVIGGWETSPARMVEIFNPTWGTWSAGPAAAVARYDHVSALLGNGKVLVASGSTYNGSSVLNSAEEFDPATTATTTSEYKLAASIDPDILPNVTTELWAAVTRPTTMPFGVRYPLLVFLHGNHGTCGTGTNPRDDNNCDYTSTGICPANYVVSPSHRGYDYAATELTSRGYIVVSINANRGITCGGGPSDDPYLIQARGRLILKHLQKLSAWNRNAEATPASLGASLASRLNFAQVGLMGHSRGGESARTAYQLYRASGSAWPGRIVDQVSFRGIFELAPTDGRSNPPPIADGIKWSVLLPMCDGDVAALWGIKPFDRMLGLFSESTATFKSTYTVWGANHNYYNSEWQMSDSSSCVNHRAMFSSGVGISGSAEQRQTGLRALVAFFRANVGSSTDASLNNLFNPEADPDFQADSRVDRGYTPALASARSRQLEDFVNAAGTSTFNIPNIHSNVTVTHGAIPEHDPAYRAATIAWAESSPDPYFQTNFANAGSGFNLTSYNLLDFRIDRAYDATLGNGGLVIAVQLVNSNGSLSSAVDIGQFVQVDGPVGGPGGYHSMLQTVRIPLSRFSSANLSSIRGVRFVFWGAIAGKIYLGNVRATLSTLVSGGAGAYLVSAMASSAAANTTPLFDAAARASQVTPGVGAIAVPTPVSSGNSVVGLRTNSSGSVELELTTSTPFTPRDDHLVLDAGGVTVEFSQHPNSDLKRVVFIMDRAEYDRIPDGAAMHVRYSSGVGNDWLFGVIDKSRLGR
jgi:hypothetical protein